MTGIAPIKQAIVKALRAKADLKSAISNEIHEAIAPEGTAFPYLTYQFAYAPYSYDWGGVIIRAGVDVVVYDRDQVAAHTLDQLVTEALQDLVLDLGDSGQTSLYSRRVADLSSVFVDDQGKRVFQMGGTYEIWTDQHLS
jgi:hypothetical protein